MRSSLVAVLTFSEMPKEVPISLVSLGQDFVDEGARGRKAGIGAAEVIVHTCKMSASANASRLLVMKDIANWLDELQKLSTGESYGTAQRYEGWIEPIQVYISLRIGGALKPGARFTRIENSALSGVVLYCVNPEKIVLQTPALDGGSVGGCLRSISVYHGDGATSKGSICDDGSRLADQQACGEGHRCPLQHF